ncbi:MAG: hypothetical protein KC413_03580, partial [Anaerolineales bacterium]|nr:hypothetical protein [Anaerolineales bacterium]
MKRLWWMGVCVLALVLVVTATAVSPSAAQESETAVDNRFGAIEAFWEPTEAADLGVGWDRILFYWNEIQPTGPEDWNTLHVLEEWLHDANAHDRTLVGLLKNTPVWATDQEPFSGVPRGLYLPVDDPGNLWANYTRRVAAYYGPLGVHHWIVWNEPDIAPDVYGHEFGGTMQDYYRLLQVAYLSIKAVDPEATIHLGGMTYWHDTTYLRRFLTLVTADPDAAANNYYFDVISQHIYFRPETIPDIVGEAYALQAELGIDPPKPVWINETNARPNMDPEWPVQVQQFHLDLEQQAWYLVQAFALGFASGAERVGVYKLIDIHLPPGGESWGLLRPDGSKSQRPVYAAYKTMTTYLGGFAGSVAAQETADYFQVTFPKPDGVVRVLWSRKLAAVTVPITALTTTAQVVQYTGHVEAVTAVDGVYTLQLDGARCYNNECYIGGPPLLLVEDGVAAEALTAPLSPALAVATITPTPLVSATPTPTDTPSPMPTFTPTATETPAPTATVTPTFTP